MDPTVTYSYVGTATRGTTANSEEGTRGYENDGNDSTSWGSYIYIPYDGDFMDTNTLTLTYTYSAPAIIKSIRLYAINYGYSTGNNYEWNRVTGYLKLTDWSDVDTTLYSFDVTTARANYTNNPGILSYTTGWTNIKKITYYAYGEARGDDAGGTRHSIFDLSVKYYNDIGLKFEGASGTQTIGVQALNSAHKLRVRDSGTTYGIELLPTTDSNASSIRIYDGAAIKSLPLSDA